MVSSADSSETPLKTFKEFDHSMKEVHLPGADDPTLLRRVYALATRRVELERQSRLATELSKGKFRQQIKAYRKTIRALRRTDEQLLRAQEI